MERLPGGPRAPAPARASRTSGPPPSPVRRRPGGWVTGAHASSWVVVIMAVVTTIATPLAVNGILGLERARGSKMLEP